MVKAVAKKKKENLEKGGKATSFRLPPARGGKKRGGKKREPWKERGAGR